VPELQIAHLLAVAQQCAGVFVLAEIPAVLDDLDLCVLA
jgi:hypothetical protein